MTPRETQAGCAALFAHQLWASSSNEVTDDRCSRHHRIVIMSLSRHLADLQLLRNDPELAINILPYARDGHVDAQYAMGLIYAEGRGVPIDLARAHYWLCLATEQGDMDARILRNVVGSQMSDDEYQASVRMRRGPQLSVVK